MPRVSVPTSAPASPGRGEKHKIADFKEHHPLALLYRDWLYILNRFEVQHWEYASYWGTCFLSMYCTIGDDARAKLEEALPYHPAQDASYNAWEMYLGWLLAFKAKRAALTAALEQVIRDQYGEAYIPEVSPMLAQVNTDEPPF